MMMMMMMMITRTTDGWVLFLCATDVGLSVSVGLSAKLARCTY